MKDILDSWKYFVEVILEDELIFYILSRIFIIACHDCAFLNISVMKNN